MSLSENASELLKSALSTKSNQIINKSDCLSAKKIVVGEKTFGEESPEQYELWLSALKELQKNELIKTTSNQLIYSVTSRGYDWQIS